jgi:hypothetical protein
MCGLGFSAGGVYLLDKEPGTAIVLCLVPGAVMLFVGGRLSLGRSRPDGTHVHPVVRGGVGILFASIGLLMLAAGVARNGLTGVVKDAIPAASFVALGVAFARGRLGPPRP